MYIYTEFAYEKMKIIRVKFQDNITKNVKIFDPALISYQTII